MIQVALIGCAHIHTPSFAGKLAAREDVKVKSVWDHDADRAKRYAEQVGGAVIADPADAFGDADIEAVIICSETDRHEDLVLPAAAAGKHMFVEKPLGLGAADSWKMAEAIEKAGVLFQTGYFMRGMPPHLFLRDEIQKGSFGQITRIRHCTCHSGSMRGIFDTEYRWMADPKIAGCGAFGDLGTHSLDILLWLMGDVETCTASVDVAVDNYEGCDETGEGLMKFKNGTLGSLAAGWVDVANPVSVIVSGTKAHALVCNGQVYYQNDAVEGADGKEPWTDIPEMEPHAFDLFLGAIAGDKNAPLVTAREAAMRSAVMEAMYRGAAEKKWVAPVTS